jgi:hypothetical protein
MATHRLHASELAQVQRETSATLLPAGLSQDQAARARARFVTRRQEEELVDRIDQARAEELARLGDTFAIRQRRARKYWGKHARI